MLEQAVLDAAVNVFVVNARVGSGCAFSSTPCGSVSELTASSGYATGLWRIYGESIRGIGMQFCLLRRSLRQPK